MGCGSARLCESKNLRSSFTSLCASWALVRFYYEAGSIVLGHLPWPSLSIIYPKKDDSFYFFPDFCREASESFLKEV